MSDLAKILPYILGAAISPVLLVMALYLLSLPTKPVKKTLLYLLSAAVTIAIITFVIIFATNINPNPAPGKDLLPHIIIGILLIALAIWIYKRGPSKADKSSVKSQGSLRFLILGAGLMLTNFTTIAMIFEIAIELRANQIVGQEKNLYFLLTVLSSILPILLPLLILLLAGKYADSILKYLSSFMSKYSNVVTSVFFGLLGVFSIIKPLV